MSKSYLDNALVTPLLLLLVAVNCASQPVVPVSDLADTSACHPIESLDTQGWQLIRISWGSLEPIAEEGWAQPLDIEFRLPTCFSEAADDEMRFMHGGKVYRCGGRRVEVSYGYWGPESFGSQLVKCVTEVEGLRIMIMQPTEHSLEQNQLLAWYGTQGSPNLEPVLEVSSPNAGDLLLLRTIAMSGRRLGDASNAE